MVISGLFIETLPGKAMAAATALMKMDGVEVHHIEGNHKIILTLEADTVDESYKASENFKKVEGVLTICLVYSNFEDDLYLKKAVDVE